jgi:hypothetical protein
MTPIERVIEDTPYRCVIEPADLIAPGRSWARIDYRTVESADVDGLAEWTIEQAASFSGLAVWFDTDLTEGVGLSAAPGAATRVYRQLYLPLHAAIAVAAGNRLRVKLSVRLVVNDYVWAWRVLVQAAEGQPERELANQNSLAESIIDPAQLHQGAVAAARRV